MDEYFSNDAGLSPEEQKKIADNLSKEIGKISEDVFDAVEEGKKIKVSEARTRERMLEVLRERSKTRVLFITDDIQNSDSASPAFKKMLELGLVFDEIHCIVLQTGKGETTTSRIAGNVYLYKVFGTYWWTHIMAARSLVKEQLIFGGVSRPDCIVALSPYAAGLVAFSLAWMLKIPWQVQLSTDPYDVSWLAADKKNKSLKRTANFVLGRAVSVRTLTEQLASEVKVRFKKITDIEVLPHFYNYSAYADGEPSFSVHDKYPDYSFIILTEAAYTADSALHDTITALSPILHNPRIGLVVIGEGRARQLFEEKVRLLRIEKSVVFLTKPVDTVSLYVTADMFISTDTSTVSEEYILRAVGATLPICAYRTDLRHDLIPDEDSAFLVEPRDSFALGKKVSKLINTPGLRTKFSRRMADIAKYRLKEDRGEYLLAIRDSIEAMFKVVESDTKKKT